MTEFFEWERERHSVWIDEMESQHHAILALMNELSRRNAEHAPKAEMEALLSTLSDLTARHFKEEEAYMAATGYPKLDVHQIIHRELSLKLQEHVHRFATGSGRLGADLLSFLNFWLLAHVNGSDRHAGRDSLGHSKERRVTPEKGPRASASRPDGLRPVARRR